MAIRDRVFGQVVVDHQRVFAIVAEIFTHRGTGVWREVQQAGWVAWTGRDDDSLIHHAFLFEAFDEASNLGKFLTDRNIDVDDTSLLLGLVDHRINRNCRLAGLSVTDDELTLATTDWEHRVDGDDTGHQWFVDRFTPHDTDGFAFDESALLGLDRRTAIEWFAEWVDNAAEQFRTDWHTEDFTLEFDGITSRNATVATKNHRTDFVFHEVECERFDGSIVGFDFEHF